MDHIDLGSLSLEELKKLQKDVNKAVDTYQDRLRREALAAAEAKAKEFGFSLAELVGAPGKRKQPGPAKYRDPENAAITWSGRGRQPGWIKEGLATGKAMEDFRIEY